MGFASEVGIVEHVAVAVAVSVAVSGIQESVHTRIDVVQLQHVFA